MKERIYIFLALFGLTAIVRKMITHGYRLVTMDPPDYKIWLAIILLGTLLLRERHVKKLKKYVIK